MGVEWRVCIVESVIVTSDSDMRPVSSTVVEVSQWVIGST